MLFEQHDRVSFVNLPFEQLSTSAPVFALETGVWSTFTGASLSCITVATLHLLDTVKAACHAFTSPPGLAMEPGFGKSNHWLPGNCVRKPASAWDTRPLIVPAARKVGVSLAAAILALTSIEARTARLKIGLA
jgi:hypothetical protein